MPRDDSHPFDAPQISAQPDPAEQIVVIGAGIGGLAAALRLVAAGEHVTVLERAAKPGGKMRTLPSVAGPVDAGPTVLTLRHVFEGLFAAAGERLEDHVTLIAQDTLARHFWPDGSTLDLFSDPARSADAIETFAGKTASAEFTAFTAKCARLFAAFDTPMMQAADPSPLALAMRVAREPSLVSAMAPLRTMATQLARDFSDPRLVQLFGRYATYVGGAPQQTPALLSLIWQAEANGVWKVAGGMHRLARAIAALAERKGAQMRMNAHVARIETQGHRVVALHLQDGTRLPCKAVVFNGDPRALSTGALGPDVQPAIPDITDAARSHSAQVFSFAAKPTGPRAKDLIHHNVFFDADPTREFAALAKGGCPTHPSIYICAEDRGDQNAPRKTGFERFEIILNAPPLQTPDDQTSEDRTACQTRTFQMLAAQGLTFDLGPRSPHLATPQDYQSLFPASLGSLYGQSPHGMTASLKRPRARTRIKGLYLAGGGTHPGAGVPMATLSGRHAAEAILQDQTSTSKSHPTATPGGTSTG